MALHWTTPPAIDPRRHLAPEARGRVAPGHLGRDPARCPACLASPPRPATVPPPAPPPPAPEAPPKPRPPSRRRAATSVRGVILRAAVEVAEAHDGEVPFGPLVVRAWELAPEHFTLPGTPYPHSARVQSKLAGPEGLVGLGWLTPHAPNTWRLTPKGQRVAARLSPPEARAAA